MTPDTQLLAIGVPFNATGTLAVTSGSGVVVGTSTLAGTEFKPDDVLLVNGQYLSVVTVTNATHFTVAPNAAASASGLTFTGWDLHTTLEERIGEGGFSRPLFSPYSQALPLGNGGVRGGGWPAAEWQWQILTRAQRDALRLLMDPNRDGLASAQLFIKTTTNEQGDVVAVFRAWMIWPQGPEARDAGARRPFSVKFQALEQLPFIT